MTVTRLPARLLGAGLLAAGGWLAVGPSGAQDEIVVDMAAIFTCEDQTTLDLAPCDEGRQLMLDNCTACHSFVQIVLRQWDPAGWNALMDKHRDRVGHLSEAQRETITHYLAAKFNPQRDPPELPESLLQDRTDY